MQHARSIRRTILLTASLLSGCAASDASSRSAGSVAASNSTYHVGAAGAYLTGRFAGRQGDMTRAADEFLKALSIDPNKPELQQQAFLSTLLIGRPEALRLARQQPDNPAAQLLLGDAAASAGNWDNAESRFSALPKQGLTQVLQPLLLAWSQQGSGHTDAALATLKPYVEGQRFRAVYALHAALIADLANRTAEAARLYRTAQTEFGTTNLQLARMLGSFEARQGQVNEAQEAVRSLLEVSDELAIAGPALKASVAQRPVRRATDGMAEAYLALAAALHAQDANDFAVVLVRLALDLRPDFTAARMLSADVIDNGKHPNQALQVLAPVPADDPLIAVVRLRRAVLTERLGNTEDALRQLDAMAHEYPDRPEPLIVKGDILRGKKRFGDAVAAYDTAVGRVPNPGRANWPLFYDRGIALERAHQWPRAEADFQKALELSPDQPAVLNYLGYSWAEQGRNLARARQMIQHAVELRPNDGSIIDSLGWVQLRDGRHQGRRALAGARGRARVRRLHHQRPSRRRLLGGRAQAGGAVPVAAGAEPQPRPRRRVEARSQAARRRRNRPRPPATAEKVSQ